MDLANAERGVDHALNVNGVHRPVVVEVAITSCVESQGFIDDKLYVLSVDFACPVNVAGYRSRFLVRLGEVGVEVDSTEQFTGDLWCGVHTRRA